MHGQTKPDPGADLQSSVCNDGVSPYQEVTSTYYSVSVKMNKLATISEQLSYPGEQATGRKEDVWDRQALVGKPIAQVRLP